MSRAPMCVLLAVTLLGAAPCPTPAPLTTSDRFTELLGSWTCRDGAGLLATRTFRRDRDAIVSSEQRSIPGVFSSAFSERYRFDAARGLWVVEEHRPYASYNATAPPWTGTVWDVAGVTSYTVPWGGETRRLPRTIRYARDGDGPLYRGTPDGPSGVSGEVCASGTTPPDAALCPAKDVAAMTLRAMEPDAGGERGHVDVLVSLDADSRVVDAHVASSTNPGLNRVAEISARRSVYRTAYHDCRPVPSQYLFSVESV